MDENMRPAAAEPAEAPLADVQICLTEEELRRSLQRSDLRRAGPGRLWVQTVLLVLLAAYCIAAFFLSGASSYASLGIGLAALILAGAQWIVPQLYIRHQARREYALGKQLRVRLYAEEIGFGSGETYEAVPYAACFTRVFDDMLLLHFQGGYLVALPRRVFDAERWIWLTGRFQTAGKERNGVHGETVGTQSDDDRGSDAEGVS